MSDLEATLQACEEQLLHTDFRQCPAELEVLLGEYFVEIPVSGQPVSREAVIHWLLNKDPQARWILDEFQVRELAENTCALVTYRARNVQKLAQPDYYGVRHSSVWQQAAAHAGWQLQFHQSTPINS